MFFSILFQTVCLFFSLSQVLLSSCLTTTECAVPCTGWGFKEERLPPADCRPQTALLREIMSLKGVASSALQHIHPLPVSAPCPAHSVSPPGSSMSAHCEVRMTHPFYSDCMMQVPSLGLISGIYIFFLFNKRKGVQLSTSTQTRHGTVRMEREQIGAGVFIICVTFVSVLYCT